jgi:protein-arginine kinase activator protein McsA
MKTKACAVCKKEDAVMYRVKITKGKLWIFVCTACCKDAQSKPDYVYGGTWKGSRH